MTIKGKTPYLYCCFIAMLSFFVTPGCKADAGNQTAAAYALVKRVVPRMIDKVVVELADKQDKNDWFELESKDGKIILRGTNGVSVASALNYYLKNYCQCQITWNGTNLKLPSILPVVPTKIHKDTPYNYRYYLNYCTFNYSMSWWDWSRWQKEIDYMALNGINMPLALTGQNIVWYNVYRKLGFTDKELETFFSGPAYFSWFWMGNLDGWGGPLPKSWMTDHEALQKQILARERELGMTPVLPAFTGHVPPAFNEKYPEASLKKTTWLDYPQVNILDPQDPMFEKIGKLFIEEETKLYGTDHLYSSDTFNENLPPTNDTTYLSNVSGKIYGVMKSADPEATWVMQGWMFYYQSDFWKPAQMKAVLNAVPENRMIILDLWSETHPVWQQTEAYYGKPWMWCMLHNFGGNVSMRGNLKTVATAPSAALNDPKSGNMVGIGLTPEAIEQNPVMYELMLENVWNKQPVDVDSWLKDYVIRRYGKLNEDAQKAWTILLNTVYASDNQNDGSQNVITSRPTLQRGTPKHTYKSEDLLPAWKLMIKASSNLQQSDGFRYDLVDLTRQVLVNYADTLHSAIASAYAKRDKGNLEKLTGDFLSLLDDLDDLLATRNDFLLGPWIESAKRCGHTKDEKMLYEKNARDQITLWGGEKSVLHDYACKQWAGLMKDFYKQRWQIFFAAMKQSALTNEKPSFDKINQQIASFEWKWVNQTTPVYPEVPLGNSVEMAKKLFHKYQPVLERTYGITRE